MLGTLYIISAPSGAGKTSLVHELMASVSGLTLSVSHTTRPLRPGEQDGVHYHFVSPADFQSMIEADAFLEYAQVFDHYYGTSKAVVGEQLKGGRDVILEIDWQGAQQVRKLFPQQVVSIFILPPSREVLENRLRARGQDSETVIDRRLGEVRKEISHCYEYDYLLVNEDFGQAVADLQSIMHTRKLHRDCQEQALRPLLDSLLGGG